MSSNRKMRPNFCETQKFRNFMKPVVIANWKMNKTAAESREWLATLPALLAGVSLDGIDVVVCPPDTLLDEVKSGIDGLILGAQNLHWEDRGTYTGEISGPMLREAGCRYVIVGHSERRWKMGETDEMVHKKLSAAWRAGLRPVLCIGERAEEKKEHKTARFLEAQLKNDLEGFSPGNFKNLLIAYEPVWAIGTGAIGSRAPATADEVRAALVIINEFLGKHDIPAQLIYGGSVDAKNVAQFFTLKDNQGFLVGGASLDAAEFASIIKQTAEFYNRD